MRLLAGVVPGIIDRYRSSSGHPGYCCPAAVERTSIPALAGMVWHDPGPRSPKPWLVSTKIGGGGDLHNMDAYAAMLWIVSVFFVGARVAKKRQANRGRLWRPWRFLRIPGHAIFLPRPQCCVPILNTTSCDPSRGTQLVETVNELGKQGPVLVTTSARWSHLGL